VYTTRSVLNAGRMIFQEHADINHKIDKYMHWFESIIDLIGM
jgi:hypothetical protein